MKNPSVVHVITSKPQRVPNYLHGFDDDAVLQRDLRGVRAVVVAVPVNSPVIAHNISDNFQGVQIIIRKIDSRIKIKKGLISASLKPAQKGGTFQLL